jgi:hypothetical protein
MAIIDFPTVKKWFIAYNDKSEIMSYGLVTPQQTMTTAWDELSIYNTKDEWLQVLVDAGIDILPIFDE